MSQRSNLSKIAVAATAVALGGLVLSKLLKRGARVPGPLLNIDELFELQARHKGSVKVLDCSWYLPIEKRDPRSEYEAKRIPGAGFFDLDTVATQLNVGGQAMPHMLPSAQVFAEALRAAGIGKGDVVVLYDNSGIFNGSCRVWWTFKAFGAEDYQLAILEGTVDDWAQKYPVYGRRDPFPAPSTKPLWPVREDTVPQWNRTIFQMMQNVQAPKEQVLDARSLSRYQGVEDEPRKVKRRGHIMGASSLPFVSVIEVKNQRFRPLKAIRAVLDEHKVDMRRPVTVYCGSGVTGSTLAFALYLAGHRRVSVYDGSWAEWGNEEEGLVAPYTASRIP